MTASPPAFRAASPPPFLLSAAFPSDPNPPAPLFPPPPPPAAPHPRPLQSFALVLLLCRFVHHLSFQPRLSVISGTIARALPDLAAFVVVVLACLLMLAGLLVVVWGPWVPELSSFGSALAWLLSWFMSGLDQGVVDAIGDVGRARSRRACACVGVRVGGCVHVQDGGGGRAWGQRVSRRCLVAFWVCFGAST